MKIPEMHGEIERRLLVTYRMDPEAVSPLLPAPYRPQLVSGFAVAGICMIRLGQLRLRGIKQWGGQRPEDAAHRIAMEFDDPAGVQTGVYIVRRDSNTLNNILAGGCIYPGRHNRSRFKVTETDSDIQLYCRALDASIEFEVHTRTTETFGGSKLFGSLDDAAAFYGAGAPDGDESAWTIEPAAIVSARSTYFDNRDVFPAGAAVPDCAVVMRPVVGKTLPPLRSDGVQSAEHV